MSLFFKAAIAVVSFVPTVKLREIYFEDAPGKEKKVPSSFKQKVVTVSMFSLLDTNLLYLF